MKKRIITLVLSALAVVLLVGVGFASWVVSQGASSEQTGNILVETVKDERLAVVVTPDGKSFQFGAPEGATAAGNKWLFEDNDAALPENLKVTYTVAVTRPTAFVLEGGQPKGLSLEAVLADTILANATATGVAFPEALFKPASPATSYGVNAAFDDEQWTMSNENRTATTTVVVELQWGDLFDNKNPYVYFNDGKTVSGVLESSVVTAATNAGLTLPAEDPTWGDLALAALTAVYGYNSYLFKLTISVDVAN